MLPQLMAAHSLGQQLHLGLNQQLLSCSSRLAGLLGVLGRYQPQAALDLGGQQACSAGGSSSSRGIVTNHTHIPRAQHDRYRTAPQNYVQLLQHISRTRDVPALRKLVQRYGDKFDAVHVAAAVAMMPKLYQPPAPGGHLNELQLRERKQQAVKLMAQLQATAARLVPRMYAAQVSSITHALSRCSSLLPGGGSSNSTTQGLLDAMLSRLTKDQARLLWQGATGSAATRLLYGLASMGYSPRSSSSASSSAAPAASQATHQLCRIIAKDPSRFHVRELATAAWALARISKRRPGLLDAPSTAAALQAISSQVVERKLWLRPNSMAALLTAAAWARRRDEALLAAVCEEATHQTRDLRPTHLSAFVWALGKLQYSPPPELLTGIVAESRRQLQHFTACGLGLLLQGLRQLGALDKQLLAEVAAGIASEEAVSLAPKDAVRILAAFVAAPDAGTRTDVGGMAQRIGFAVRREARNAGSGVMTDLVVCYSKLPYYHPIVPQLLGEARAQEDAFSLAQWVKLLQAAARLGLDVPVEDPQLEASLAGFYRAADSHLHKHVQQALLGRAAAEAAQQQGDGEEQGLTGRLSKLAWGGKGGQQQGGSEQQEQQALQAGMNEIGAIVEIAAVLGRQRQQQARVGLSDATAVGLAEAGLKLLPVLKLRQLSHLLGAVTCRGTLLAGAHVQQLLSQACEQLKGLDLGATPTATTTVLVALLQPLSVALSRGLPLTSGQEVVRAIFAELLPVLEECSQQQLQAVWEANRRTGGAGEALALAARLREVAARNGWQLQTGSLGLM